jgi:tetratricopeptide (TPR) repeat protein
MIEKKYEDSYRLFNEYIKLRDDYAPAWYYKGYLEDLYFNKYEEAISSYNMATSIDVDYADPYYSLGLLYKEIYKDNVKAKNYFSKAYELGKKAPLLEEMFNK